MATATTRALPETYRTLVGLGWRWAVRFGAPKPHLVPPHGDAALCLTVMSRGERLVVTTGIADHGCKKCKIRAGLV